MLSFYLAAIIALPSPRARAETAVPFELQLNAVRQKVSSARAAQARIKNADLPARIRSLALKTSQLDSEAARIIDDLQDIHAQIVSGSNGPQDPELLKRLQRALRDAQAATQATPPCEQEAARLALARLAQ